MSYHDVLLLIRFANTVFLTLSAYLGWRAVDRGDYPRAAKWAFRCFMLIAVAFVTLG